ncbi:MAG: hypothetical protein M1836_002152 [Candelina mexicana]|nr:MAG: hypothetical protein M1836_002152 [Candelina mexicana]
MKSTGSIVLIGTVVGSLASNDGPRPRGVGPEFSNFYKATDSFTCISHPTIKLPISHLNDDYCDCPDGSDEPGTSACSYLSPSSPKIRSNIAIDDINTTLALPGFYCKNKGHQPSYLSFTRVNDGICDYDLCCDGSDEWEGVGGVKCEDRCKEIGKEWRKQDEQRKRSMNAAAKKRKELVAESARLRKEVADRIDTLGAEIEGSKIKVAALEKQLAEVEKREKGKVVRGPGKGSRVNILAQLAKGRVEELRTALVQVREQRDASKERLRELEGILAAFHEEYNPNFNDEGVKRAVRSWEDYTARDNTAGDDSAYERDLEEIAKPDGESDGIQWAEWEGQDEESDVDVLYKFEEYLPKPVREWIDGKLRDLRVLLIDNGILADNSDPSNESSAVTSARNALNAANHGLNTLNDQLIRHKEDLDKDFGADDVFRALKGRCVSKDSGEYTYELCWMERTTQKPKKGGGDTGMGNYVSFDKITVDDTLPPDGKGLGSSERVTMRYENGQHCWNGPNRSTLVVLACAEKDEIWKVTEEEKCVYRMEVGTPAACEAKGGEKGPGHVKDEL